MKWAFRIILLIILLFLVGMGAGAFMSPLVHVERSITIEAEAPDIFPYMNDLRAFQDWSPWFAMDPDADYVFGGPAYGEGQSMAWRSNVPKLGDGSQTIMESFQDSFVRTELNLAGRDAQGTYAVEPLDTGGTSALIGLEFDLGGFPYVQRVFAFTQESRIGIEFDSALQRLKARVEADVAQP